MSRKFVDLSHAGHGNFRRTWPSWYEALWILTEFLVVTNPLQPSSHLRGIALRWFGARIGKGVILRPRLRVKFPWNLEIGDRCWIGEGVWIHNQDKVTIGHDSVVSQETFITTGSHDVRGTMDLIVKPVEIGSGVWITSRCIVQQGVQIGDDAIVTPGSVVHKSVPAGWVFGGNPVRAIKERLPDG